MKFCFRLKKGTDALEDTLEGIDIPKLYDYLQSLKPGTKMHLIVRPRPGFDVEGMRNYFHGPMLNWIVKKLGTMGIRTSGAEMRDELKRRFIGIDADGKTLSIADTLEVKTKGDVRSPEEKYKEFLNDVRLWCIDTLGSEPPEPDEVDLDEESESCATAETTR